MTKTIYVTEDNKLSELPMKEDEVQKKSLSLRYGIKEMLFAGEIGLLMTNSTVEIVDLQLN